MKLIEKRLEYKQKLIETDVFRLIFAILCNEMVITLQIKNVKH